MKPFLENITPTAYFCLLITLVGQILDGMRNASVGKLRAYGDTKSPMTINLLTMLLINIPMAFISSFVFNNSYGVWSARTVGIAAGAVAVGIKAKLTANAAEKLQTILVITEQPTQDTYLFTRLFQKGKNFCSLFFSPAPSNHSLLAQEIAMPAVNNYSSRFKSCVIV
jgi:hypothetical protein